MNSTTCSFCTMKCYNQSSWRYSEAFKSITYDDGYDDCDLFRFYNGNWHEHTVYEHNAINCANCKTIIDKLMSAHFDKYIF